MNSEGCSHVDWDNFDKGSFVPDIAADNYVAVDIQHFAADNSVAVDIQRFAADTSAVLAWASCFESDTADIPSPDDRLDWSEVDIRSRKSRRCLDTADILNCYRKRTDDGPCG